MRPGHRNELLDSSRVGPLPRRPAVDRWMDRWHFSTRRHVPHGLVRRLERERPAIVLGNLQMQSAVPFLVAGRRLGLPLVGYVASWDHTVGKGVIWPGLDRYLVQNERMRGDLVRFHDVPRERIVVTGWPQSDVFHGAGPGRRTRRCSAAYALDPGKPLVLVMGNTPTNTPDEARFFARLVAWWAESGADARFSLLFRPHPRDSRWRERFAVRPRAWRASPSRSRRFTDIEALATLLQHGDCVVTNAGTILLDALVNDRPVVCVLYDEGSDRPARRVVGGEERDRRALPRRQRVRGLSTARSRSRRSSPGSSARSAHPDELAGERRRLVATVVGEVDGRAAERVVDAMLDGIA